MQQPISRNTLCHERPEVVEHLVILNFHGIGQPRHALPPGEERVWIGKSQFETILDYVKTQEQIELTFDDANESDYRIALPALQARAMTARFFVVADRVDRPFYVSRAQLSGLVAAGMKIGNHGLRHCRWAGLKHEELHAELVHARDVVEQMIGAIVGEASCPFGSYNRRVIRALRDSGYRHVYTSDCGWARVGSFLQERNSVYRTDDLNTIKALASGRPGPVRRFWRACRLAAKRYR